MRTRPFVLGLFGIAIVGMATVQACGGDADPVPAADGGADGAQDARARDATLDVADTGPSCDLTGDFWEDIPDAALTDGGTTTGICLGCLQDHCQELLDECNTDCNCRTVVGDFLACYLESGEVLSCFTASSASPSSKTQQIGQQLYGCLQSSCEPECSFETNTDAGDASDDG